MVLRQIRTPDACPDEQSDLIVLSEIGCYCTELSVFTDHILGTLTRDGVVLTCRWRRAAPDQPKTAEQDHGVLGRDLT